MYKAIPHILLERLCIVTHSKAATFSIKTLQKVTFSIATTDKNEAKLMRGIQMNLNK